MTERNFLKIGIDYHGVIDRNPSYFRDFACELTRLGHRIYVITGGPYAEVSEALQEHDFCHEDIFAVLDYYEGRGIVEHYAGGGFHIEDTLWNSAKSKYCRDNQINLHIDDSKIYLQYFTTPYCLYDNQQQICTLNQEICIDFRQSPQDAARQVSEKFSK